VREKRSDCEKMAGRENPPPAPTEVGSSEAEAGIESSIQDLRCAVM
jgi:hypothetical protein